MIKIDSLYKKYGENHVLKGVDLEIEQGVIAILGPNGSGKTTLNKCILGMVFPDSGNISIDNQSVLNKWDYRQKIDYLPQIANFPSNITVQELLNMIKDLRGNKTQDEKEYIELFHLSKFLNKKLSALSGGTKQKVNILLTFMFDNPIMILDEPTTGLDPVALLTLKDLIIREKNKGKIILVTSHIMDFVEGISDEIVFILEGKIYFKGSIELLKEKTNQESFEKAIANILKQNYA
ncbi:MULTISPECIES: ABC transporter ATP-binding protein [Myroides]|uniref:ATP-binding cassette domain-containing protein n=1 Tax=Myroides albus TaxID=2562892 RepID=A0A6I3LJP8_9FLAO|nr:MULTISPECIES: ABC transporter ATP-binding protein [Myroides]MTG98493.1 ATP-binding cassette domain-containing protein [Myroides albus]MVX34677.1 ATP-binding cassette domain-containing protein [Myroides sp. LoEW2-1]UVD79516.1 ABC transporter ATP-binding protein [Myroides albus]